jgi:MFS family permease
LSAAEPEHPTLSVLRISGVRRFVTARFFAGLGRSLLRATIHWHLWKVTGSAFYLGVMGLVEFLPVIPASLLAGAVADSRDRRKIMIASQCVTLVCAGILCLGSYRGQSELPLLLATGFVLAIASAFENPATSSLLPTLVPRALFPAATVVSSNLRNVAAVSGPVLMGFIAARAGIAPAYGTTCALVVASILTLSILRSRHVRSETQAVSLSAIAEGVRFVRQSPVLLGAMSLDMFVVVFASVNALLPIFATEILGVDEFGYGLLTASIQAGTVLMALILLVARPLVRPGRALMISIVFFGLATILFAFTRSFPLAVLALVITGMADQVSMVSRSVIVQLSTPDALRGRVNSVNMIFIGVSNEIGAAESGFLAALTSATFSVAFGGVACLSVLAGVAVGVPSLRSYRLAGQSELEQG